MISTATTQIRFFPLTPEYIFLPSFLETEERGVDCVTNIHVCKDGDEITVTHPENEQKISQHYRN